MATILAAKPTEAFPQIGKWADCTLSSRPREFHPQPLSEPYVKVSLHKDILANKLISFAGFFLILVCCVGSILLIIYFVGFTSLERDFFLRMIRSRLKR